MEQKNFERPLRIILLISAVLLFLWTIGLITYYGYLILHPTIGSDGYLQYYDVFFIKEFAWSYGVGVIDFIILYLAIKYSKWYFTTPILIYRVWDSLIYCDMINTVMHPNEEVELHWLIVKIGFGLFVNFIVFMFFIFAPMLHPTLKEGDLNE